jgi:hypothetical protein
MAQSFYLQALRMADKSLKALQGHGIVSRALLLETSVFNQQKQ